MVLSIPRKGERTREKGRREEMKEKRERSGQPVGMMST